MLLPSRPCDPRRIPRPKQNPAGGSRADGILCLAQQEDHQDYSPPDSDGIGEQLAGSESSPDRGGKVVGLDGPPLPKRVAITEWDSLEQAEVLD